VRPTILTKDGTERLYRMKLALSNKEPLRRAGGSIEFWEVDGSKVISVVVGKDCST
jgi:hypothetical protein